MKPAINSPGDEYEQEADRVAEQVLRMPDAGLPSRARCKEGKAGVTVQTERVPSMAGGGSLDIQTAVNATRQCGEPLPADTKDFFEQRFDRDFSHVQVHTYSEAAEAVLARAYTLGSHIVFGHREYAPSTAEGKRLLAHELTHVVQQGAAEATPIGHAAVAGLDREGTRIARPAGEPAVLQRKLVIEPTTDTSDPANRMPTNAQRDIVRPLVQNLCPDFDVPASSPLRVEETGTRCKDIQSGTRSPHTGCCCLCALTNPFAARWTITVSQNLSPQTDPVGRTVIINPSGSPIESMHWTSGGGAGERMVNRPRVITFGHELCGHAALMEIGSHPAGAARETSDVHDPTIKIERGIWGEQGLPAADQRGLAGGGVHRGESVYRLTLDRFPLNVSDPATLPAGEQAELQELKRFSSSRRWFIEVHGHSDHSGSPTVKQDISVDRAEAVRDNLKASPNGSNYSFVKTEGHSDSQPITGASAERLRRVDVILSLFRSGVPTPPTSASPVTHIGPDTPRLHSANLASGDICIRHLATQAWT